MKVPFVLDICMTVAHECGADLHADGSLLFTTQQIYMLGICESSAECYRLSRDIASFFVSCLEVFESISFVSLYPYSITQDWPWRRHKHLS
jgi:hypothetical protein